MLYDLRANASRWTLAAAKFNDKQTMVHGDFHRGNLFFRQADPDALSEEDDCAVLDWAFYGTGHCCWELYYFMRNVWASRDAELDCGEARHSSLCAWIV